MIKGIDLSDLILKLLFFDIKTLIIGSPLAKTVLLWKTQKNKRLNLSRTISLWNLQYLH